MKWSNHLEKNHGCIRTNLKSDRSSNFGQIVFAKLNWVTVWRHWQIHPRNFFRNSSFWDHGGSDISLNDLAGSKNSVSVHRCRPGILTWFFFLIFPSKLGHKILNEIVQKKDLYSGEGIESKELGFDKLNKTPVRNFLF